MHEIDFLPHAYRQTHQSRRNRAWGMLVVGLFAGLLGTLAFAQYRRWSNLQYELAEADKRQQVSQTQSLQLTALRAELKKLGEQAELLTYLRHPWPRTQFLHAALKPLPSSITLADFQIHRTAKAPSTETSTRPATQGSRRRSSETAAPEPKRTSVEADLARLRAEFDQATVVVVLSGITTDHLSLHRYLSELGAQPLFETFELQSIEEVPNRRDLAFQFRAIGRVVPGYGQPGCPQPPDAPADPPTVSRVESVRVSQREEIQP